MVTSISKEDGEWDEPWMFQTTGYKDTHYVEAVINHHEICDCEECISRQNDSGLATAPQHSAAEPTSSRLPAPDLLEGRTTKNLR